MSRIRSAVTAAACLAAVGFASAVRAQETRDVSALAVTIASVEPVGKWDRNAIVTLKVANRGKGAAEPLTFAVTAKDGGEAVVMRRVPGPYTGRAGRPVPPGGTQTYQVLFPGEHARLAGAKAKVVDASFPSTVPPADVPVQVGTPRTEKRNHEMGGDGRVRRAAAQEPDGREARRHVRATFEKPSAATVLIHRRLKPKEEVEATFTDLICDPAPEIANEDPGWSVDFVVPKGAKIAKAVVVDWCLVGTGDAADAAKLLKEAVRAAGSGGRHASGSRGPTPRKCAPRPGPPPIAREVQRGSGWRDLGPIRRRARRRMRCGSRARSRTRSGICSVRPRRKPSRSSSLSSTSSGRPSSSRATARVGTSGEYRRARFAVAQGRIVGDTWYGGSPNDVHCEWLLESFEGGYVVGERRAFNIGGRGKPTEVHRWRYGRFDGLLVPLKYSRVRGPHAGRRGPGRSRSRSRTCEGTPRPRSRSRPPPPRRSAPRGIPATGIRGRRSRSRAA